MDLIVSGSSLRVRDFFNGNETPATLALIVEAYGRKPTSFFFAARSQDDEVYALMHGNDSEDEESRPTAAHPDPVTFGTTESLLATLIELIQANNHYTAHAKGKPKPKRIPRPETAAAIYKRRQAREAFEQIEAAINFVESDELRTDPGASIARDIRE